MWPIKDKFYSHSWCVLGAAFFVLLIASSTVKAQHFEPGKVVGFLSNNAIVEASGMAVSRAVPDRYWLINDSGHDGQVFAINSAGDDLGSIRLVDASNRDWEDLTSFSLDGKHYVAVGDIGDNLDIHKSLKIHVFREPETLTGQEIKPAWTIEFTLPAGPVNFEAMGADPVAQRFFLISKRTDPIALYSVPYRSDAPVVAALELDGVNIPAVKTTLTEQSLTRHFGRPTALDILEDGSAMVVLTYIRALWYARSSSQTWAQALASEPTIILLPFLPQSEALALSQDAQQLFITTEMWPTPLLRLNRSP